MAENQLVALSKQFAVDMKIALKECYETDYWLGVFHEAGIITKEEYNTSFSQCSKLRKLLIASITTAKKNNAPGANRE